MSTKTTRCLAPGDVVRVTPRIVRTVDRVADSGWIANNGRPILNVYYAEGAVGGWSDGNSGTDTLLWELPELCSANTGGDPSNGCERWADDSGYCPAHT